MKSHFILKPSQFFSLPLSSNIHLLERLRNALNRGMAPAPAPVQEYDKRTSRELSEAVPQTDILGKIVIIKLSLCTWFVTESFA